MARQNIYALSDVADIVARALSDAIEEHGMPNTFTPGELAAEYVRGAYVRAASMGNAYVVAQVVATLARAGVVAEYRDRRFHVSPRPVAPQAAP